ncbi:hypothetical protein [Bacillus sp. 1P06AnD]|uniref:hypothetical protein n=1 Tax=Bacillus sp. 1P06AnD TaxID=3132208 RepID=UPI0039A0ED01
MPKIYRIRIAGLKYDGMQKQYGNTIFDFNNDEEATNGLIALMNGGGKGVLLQTIFQVLKPGTTWGEENNRHYQQFFYNKQEQFVPYTFHVAIEWELDGGDNRHLISGGIFSAAKTVKMREGDEGEESLKEETISPIFHFYAKEFGPGEGVNLADIPLFKDGQALSAEEVIGDFLQWQDYHIYKKPSEHYKLMATYGINRKDWDIIKDINLSEGGVGKYFEGAEDDYALFKKKIVPTVSQVINKHDLPHDDLVDIFKNQASIAKDLPILLKREEAHLEFLELILPFQQSIEQAIEHEDQLEEHIQQGRQILGALEFAIEEDQNGLKEIEKKVALLENTADDLRFQKDNIEFAKLHSDKKELQLKIESYKEKHANILVKLEELREKEEEQKLLIAVKEWEELENKVKNLLRQKEALEQSDQLTEVNDRMDQLKAQAEGVWNESCGMMQEEIDRFDGYKKYLHSKGKEYNRTFQQKVSEVEQLKVSLLQLEQDIQEFEGLKERVLHEFGDKVAYALPEVITEFRQKMVDAEEQKEMRMAEEKESQHKQSILATEIGKLGQSIEEMKKKIHHIKEELQRQTEREQKISAGLYSILKREIGPMSKSSLAQYMSELDELLEDLAMKQEKNKRGLWESQLDQSLNDGDFWIPNKDVKWLKEWLSAQTDSDVFYGTEYLLSLSEENRANCLSQFPLLAYGLVVDGQLHAEWQDRQMDPMLLRSPVALFTAETLQSSPTDDLWVLRSDEQQLILEHGKFSEWKNTLAENVNKQADVIKELGKTQNSIEKMWRELDKLNDSIFSSEIEDNLSASEQELEKTIHSLQLKKKKQEEEEARQRELAESISALTSSMAILQKNIQTLETYEAELARQQERKQTVKNQEERKLQLLKDQETIIKQQNDVFQAKDSWQSTYLTWKLELEHKIKRLIPFVDERVYPNFDVDVEESDVEPLLSIHILDELMVLIQEMEQLEKSKEERVQELKVVQAQLEHIQETKLKQEQKMADRTNHWKSAEVPAEPVLVLERKLESIKNEVVLCEKAEREQSDCMKTADGTMAALAPQLEKAEKKVKKHGKEAELWEDVNLENKEMQIQQEMLENKAELKAATALQEEAKERIRSFESNTDTMAAILEDTASLCLPEHKDAVRKHAKKCVDEWISIQKNKKEAMDAAHLHVEKTHKLLKRTIEEKNWESRLKKEWLASLNLMNLRQYKNILIVIIGMKRFSASGLEQLEKDKERAMKAQEIWAVRASMKVMKIADSIRSMVAKMKFKNESGHTFPLVKFKEDILPKKAEDVEELLKQHFVFSIERIVSQFESIDVLNKEMMLEIKKLVADEKILFVALRNRYPELLVYNMRTDNAFMYKAPSKEHYSTWKTINQGSKTKSDGSGGQKLSARMVMMMMLLSVKNETDRNWVTLLCDNPFGQAASTHVLDPIFTVAQKLRFQLIVVTPPELVKTDISQRFDVFYKLDFKRVNGKDMIQDTVVPMFRIHSHHI